MTLTITLDWISVTFKEMSDGARLWLDTFASAETGLAIKPINGYRSGVQAKSGVCVFWNLDRPEMGYHYQFSGSALRCIWGDYGLDQRETIQRLYYFGGRFTRLDLAKDIQGKTIDYDTIYAQVDAGDYIGTARSPDQRKSPNGGNTVYIGSWKSDKFIRLYNKAAESKLEGPDWSRLELVMKSDYARSLAWNLVHNDNWSAVFDGVVIPTCSIPNNPDWMSFFPLGDIPIGLPKLEKKTDREAWIDSQVTPAVVKHFTENRESPAIRKLRMMLDYIDNVKQPDVELDNL